MDLLYWSRHFRNMPGEGDLPVREFMQAVAATGYDGYLSLEIFNDQFRGGSPRAISVDGHRSLKWLMDQVSRSEPAIAAASPRIPDRVDVVEGVEFIEFSANEAGAGEIAGLLQSLGFRKVGRHVSKDVTLYRQGGIKILVNTERQGFAHSSFVVHGTSIYAIGLKVADARSTMERALALDAEPFAQTVPPGQLVIPAVRGVGGSVIYFLELPRFDSLADVWDREFRPVDADGGGSGVGLTRIGDHIGQTMNQGEMPSWLLFYTAIFNTRASPRTPGCSGPDRRAGCAPRRASAGSPPTSLRGAPCPPGRSARSDGRTAAARTP